MHYPRKSQRKCTKKSRTYPPPSPSFYVHSFADRAKGQRIDARSPAPEGSEAGLRIPYLVGNKEVS